MGGGGGGPEMLAAAAVNQVVRKISDYVCVAQGEVKLLCSFGDDLESIKNNLVYLEDMLKNAENNSFGSQRENLRHWLAEMKSLAYDIEDILDEYYCSKEQFEGSSCAQKGSLFCSLYNPMYLKVGMVHKMKSMRDMLQTRQQLPIQYQFVSDINSPVTFEEKQTTSYLNNDIAIIGRGRDLENIMHMLMQGNAEELSIISIVGPVGFGKTSLAQLVFNNVKTENSFNHRIWVHVSMGAVNLERIGKDIISQTSERIDGNMQLQSIKNAVQCILNGRCLIILDGLWGKDDKLNDLKQMLMTGRETMSKVIVTTHSEQVAMVMSTVPPYKLAALSEDDCSTIFTQRAMAGHGDPLFREYGKEIVRRCEGTPLVANFLGSIVNAQRHRREVWLAARDKEMWKLEEDYPGDRILPMFPSFKLIYYNMPHALRLCLVYCSIFPKGSDIDKKKLIQQWIALDMIESRHRTLPLDATAEKYIQELITISFLQVSERHLTTTENSSAPEEVLCMHNSAHDLARSVASKDILVILDAGNERNARYCNYRYAHLSASNLQSIDHKAWPLKARSLIFRTSDSELEHVSEILSVNKFLRVLDLSGCSITALPTPIFQLKQLRYLDASSLPISTLPPEMSSFQKLKALDLSGTELEMLPSFISSLKMLNYLNLQGCHKLKDLSTSLDMLHELHHLNLSFCPEVGALPASLENLRKLRFLNLSNCCKLQRSPSGLLQSFASLSALEDLNLSGFELQTLPDFFGTFYSLQFLNLSKCSKLELLPESFGELVNLKVLNLSCCFGLKDLHESFGNLRSLQFLNLSNCSGLQYLPTSFGMLSNLEDLNLSQCFGLRGLPSSVGNLIERLRDFKSSGCQESVIQSCFRDNNLEITGEIDEDNMLGNSKPHQRSEQVDRFQYVSSNSRERSEITPRETVQQSQQHQVPSPPPPSFASSSSAPPSTSTSLSDISITGIQYLMTKQQEKCQEPQMLRDGLIPKNNATVKGSTDMHTVECDGA